MTDFADKSGITPKTKIAIPLAAAGTVCGLLIWVGMTINSAAWRLQTVEEKTKALETKVGELPTKADFIRVRVDLLEQMEAKSEETLKAIRRRPR